MMKILNQRTRGVWLLLFALALCPQAFAETVTNTYDTLNRLTSVVYGNGQQITYTYDPAGNRTAMSGNTLTTPTAFSFTPQTNVALNTQIASNAITVSGVNAAPTIAISGGEYSINGGPYTAVPGNVSNGQTVTVRLTSAATNNTTLAATLNIGGVSGTFNATTLLPPTPTAFSFTAQTGVPLGAWITSNTVTLGGLSASTNISIAGGEYSINGGAFTTALGTINNAQTVAVRVQASTNNLTKTTATLIVGGLSVSFSVTTVNTQTVTANLTAGWNLLGNSVSTPLDVTTLGDTSKVTTVWKWVSATSKWAFYAPTMTAPDLATYATNKGYDVLATISGGEGFWVNAKIAFTASLPAGTSIGSNTFADSNKLSKGWSLIAVGDNLSPRNFANAIAVSQPVSPAVAATSITTLWAWDSAQSGWYFYAPSMDNAGTLAGYIANKGYLDFTAKGKILDPTTGFWVNR